jgi:hypothetical protein
MQWEEYHTGVIRTQIDDVGVTEFQFIAMAIIFTPVVLNQYLTEFKPLFGISITEIIVYLILIL